MSEIGPFETLNSDIGCRLTANVASMMHSVSKEHEKILEKKQQLTNLKSSFGIQSEDQIEINFGGVCLEVDREELNAHPNSLMLRFALISGKYDHLLPKDKNGRVFLDWDAKWIQPHLGFLQDVKLWDGDENTKPVLPRNGDGESAALMEFFYEIQSPPVVVLNRSCLILRNDITDADDIILSFLTDSATKPSENALKTKLIFRGSSDGFTSTAFHAKCDGHKETILLVKTTSGDIFGCYLDVPWQSGSGWVVSDKCFVFSLKRGAKVEPVKHKNIAGSCGAYCNLSHNMVYLLQAGAIYIPPTGCNTSSVSNSHLSSVVCETHGQASLASSNPFQVSEIEVFEVEVVKSCNYNKTPVPSATNPGGSLTSSLLHVDSALPSLATVLHETAGLYAEVQKYCADLIRADHELLLEAVVFRDELRFVAGLVGIALATVNTGKKKKKKKSTSIAAPGRNESFETVLNEIGEFVSQMAPPLPISNSTTSQTTASSARFHSDVITIKVSGVVLAVNKATLQQAPVGSPLCNMASDVWGHDLDSDGHIMQRVNVRLFTLIINHLRLKALLPADKVPPIVIHKSDKNALDNMLAFYGMSEAPIECI